MEDTPSPHSAGTGHDAPARSSVSSAGSSGSHSYYARHSFTRSGWCGTCGLRRGPDGRCSNCDPWWTSPLIQYGAPLIIASTFLLLMGVSLLRPKSSFLAFGKPPIAVPASGPRGYSSIPVPSPAAPGAMYQPIPVPQYHPANYAPPPPNPVAGPNSVAAYAPLPTPAATQEAAMWANQRQLNRLAMSVNAAMQADEAARQQASRAFYSSSGARMQTMAPARAMRSTSSVAPTGVL